MSERRRGETERNETKVILYEVRFEEKRREETVGQKMVIPSSSPSSPRK